MAAELFCRILQAFLVMLMQHSEVVGGIVGLVLYYWQKRQCVHTHWMHYSNTRQRMALPAKH